MQDIELQALQTFQKNLIFFETHHKAVFDKIALLNHLIDEESYIEKYALEYRDNSYFDIIELQSGDFLYNNNSNLASDRMVDAIDLKRTGAVFKAQKFVLASDEQAEAINISELTFHNSLWSTIKITNYVSKYASSDTTMDRVYKTIFLGIGLGLHLEKMIKKLNSQVIFIKEKNLETFRLSLFVTDYSELPGELFFSLTDDESEERENFINFLNRGNNYNLNLKHVPFTLDYHLELQRLQAHVLSQSYINYGYSAMLLRFIDSPKYLSQSYNFLKINIRHTNNIFETKPVLLLFSGPSTSKEIEWVITNRHRFIVVSPLSSCRLLQHHNIKPDIVVHIDPGENTSTLFEGLETDSYFSNSHIILASNVDEVTLKRFNPQKTYLIEQGTSYKYDFGSLSAPSVGDYCYGLFLIFGVKQLFMLGIDLALDAQTLQSHAGFHPYQITGQYDSKSASLDSNSSIEYTKGNFSDQVPTLASYKLSIDQIKIFAKMLKKKGQHIYNLSQGAFLEGSTPLSISDYNWEQLPSINSTKVHAKLGEFFGSIGSNLFRDIDKTQISYQIKEAKKLEKTIKQHQKKKFANAQAYLNSLSTLSWDLSDMDYKTRSDLAQVYYEYFSIVMSYIFDLFNSIELEKPDKHVTQIDAILVKQLLKMSTLYITKLESYLK